MADSSPTTSTRPYLVRAIYEWCTDNGYTPYIVVSVNADVRVPMELSLIHISEPTRPY